MRPALLTEPADALPSNPRRGFAGAAALHAAAVMALLTAAAGARLAPDGGGAAVPDGPVVELVPPPVSLRPPVLVVDGPTLEAVGTIPPSAPFTTAGGFSYDTARIRLRREVLFPFLTGRLPFLDELRAAAAAERRQLRSPLGARNARRSADRPPLRLSAAQRDALIDASWSRRDRWRSLATLVELAARHDPDEGHLPAVVRGHVERNLLQPYVESSPPDPRFWVMLGLAADHLDVIQFVGRYAQEHPSSRTTTELPFLLDELAEARDGRGRAHDLCGRPRRDSRGAPARRACRRAASCARLAPSAAAGSASRRIGWRASASPPRPSDPPARGVRRARSARWQSRCKGPGRLPPAGGPMKPSLPILALGVLLSSTVAHAQQSPTTDQQPAAAAQGDAVRQQGAAIERTVRRFRLGVAGGAGLDPEIIDVGVHANIDRFIRNNVSFRPGLEIGAGEITTLLNINLDVLYAFDDFTEETRWVPYVGAGPAFGLSHRGVSADDVDDPDIDDLDDDERNRFDFSDTDFNGGVNFIVGMRRPSGVFFEMKATAWGVSNIRLLAGFNF